MLSMKEINIIQALVEEESGKTTQITQIQKSEDLSIIELYNNTLSGIGQKLNGMQETVNTNIYTHVG